MPLILKMYYLPFKGLKTLIEKLIPSYELRKRRINKEPQRKNYGTYKRNDYNSAYYFLGYGLEWIRMDDSKTSMICKYINGLTFDAHSNYKQLMNECISTILSFRKTFKKYL
ncbi:MAG: hypothetical protein SPJ17_02420 [Anaeroplasma sp.]|uniref:hypothetical protein n=1 Tax=Anaeroplasma sp. TaxID=1872523 RepID=UPI002A90BF86|nr:hypothetical protein [Anaeroplasma sp.]MDY5982544.1 hypothetical protein [Anaeroplasma sp.]